MRSIYLDHAATTPVREEVIEAMVKVLRENYGNPSSIHQFGRPSRKLIEEAREKVAKAINADPREIIFVGSGTEADNLAILGSARANKKKGNHLITTSVEHHAVLDAFKALEKEGFEVTYLPVDGEGRISVADFKNALRDNTILVSVMHANNEVGTIMPVEEIGAICREKKILFHVDAVQAVGKIPVDVTQINCDFLALSGHKIYGPKGIGVLYMRRGVRTQPLYHGGGQERKLRPGTENVPNIVGLGVAIELAVAEMETESPRLAKLRDKLIDGVLSTIPETRLNGPREGRLPHNANISIVYVEGEALLLTCDMKGMSCSSGSACTSGSLDPSHVLMAMGLSHTIAHGSLRLSLGHSTTEDDIDYIIRELKPIADRLRAMSPVWENFQKGLPIA
ncbi:cysteine desulfurase NifS [Tumebacillus permanentifrigoris]|uniref:Cysteine desulfurase IscS n=1 Tax=Tumebacillus permanentifrigoris TaxID=378543 RepID=A0A316DD70_9BACL|nr:cysteine desulfurase NifS [Tumebacillus permanentifrigoris]PWK15944.1 cysteine desulfurase [Tumebacillus permanentifrigoris]